MKEYTGNMNSKGFIYLRFHLSEYRLLRGTGEEAENKEKENNPHIEFYI